MDNPGQTRHKVFFENLDGLRFLCFLAVFLYHSFHTELAHISDTAAYRFIKTGIFGNGNIGVNFFFVLSGFLITYLLIEEKKVTGQVHIRFFWVRRILRIWPLYYLCVAFGFLAFPLLKTAFGQVPDETADPWYYVTFLGNFDHIRKGVPDASNLAVLWSVAVEEQFYLVWPVVLAFVPVRRYWAVFLAIIAGSLWYRACNTSYLAHEMHTLSCIGDMAVGAMGSWLVQQRPAVLHRLERLDKGHIALIYTAFLAIFFFRKELLRWSPAITVVERVIIAVVIVLIILEQNYARNSFIKMARFKWMGYLGRISYGLYCLHFIGILIALRITAWLGLNQTLAQVAVLETGLALAVTIALAHFSYQYYEKPFLRLKDRFAFITK